MKEYIERALAVQELEVLRQEYEMHDDCDELVARRCRDALSAVPAANVAEVRHGRGIAVCGESSGLNWKCSLCAKRVLQKSPYCPNCGALMKEEEHEAD